METLIVMYTLIGAGVIAIACLQTLVERRR